MLKLDDAFLAEVGLAGLPESERGPFLRFVYETIQVRVGAQLAARLTDGQLAEFDQLADARDDASSMRFVSSTVPDYQQVVRQVFERLKSEIAASAPQILDEVRGTAADRG